MSRKVLVTGGAGFIGSHTCKQLAHAGYEPIAYDNLSTGHRAAVQWGPLIQGDIRDTEALQQALRKYKPLGVIHFAASAYVGESVEDPGKYYSNNVMGTWSVLTACVGAGLYKLVFSSSCATYGIPASLPISEDAAQKPINPYGRTKLIGEWMLEDFRRAYGLRSVALRYFNASGADPDGKLCENHDPETHLIPRTLLAAAGKLSQLEVFGNDYPTADGTCVRDFIHVADLAIGHVLALEYLLAGGDHIALNLGTGIGTSVKQIIASVERATNRSVPTAFSPRRVGDPPVLVADGSLARASIGFQPRYSELDTIVGTAAPSFVAPL